MFAKNWRGLTTGFGLLVVIVVVVVFAAWVLVNGGTLVFTLVPEFVFVLAVCCLVGAAQVHPKSAPILGLFLFATILFAVYQNPGLFERWLTALFNWIRETLGPAFPSIADLFGTSGSGGKGSPLAPDIELPYAPQIVILLVCAVAFVGTGGALTLLNSRSGGKVAGQPLTSTEAAAADADKAGEKQKREPLHPALGKPAMQNLIAWSMALLMLIYLFPAWLPNFFIQPGASNKAAFLRVHDSVPMVAILVLLSGFLFIGRQDASKSAPTKEADKPKNVTEADMDALFAGLQGLPSEQTVGSISFAGRRAAPTAGKKAAEPKDNLPLLHAQVERALKVFGSVPANLQTGPLLKALDTYESGRERNVTAVADAGQMADKMPGVLIEDTLLDYKLVLIAALMAHHISFGRNVTLLADGRRINDLVRALQQTLAQFLPTSTCIWADAGAPAGIPSASPVPKVLWGDCRSVLTRAKPILQGATAVGGSRELSKERAFFLHLGLVIVLDLHLLDLLELAQLLRVVQAAGRATEGPAAQVVLQCEPVQNLKDAAKNCLPVYFDEEPLRLSDEQAAGQATFVWNNVVTGEGDAFLGVAEVIRSQGGEAMVIDETKEEDVASWTALAGKLSPTKQLGLRFVPSALGEYAGAQNRCFIDRDRGNLAAAVLRDVASPGGGRGVLILMSDPIPIQKTLKAGIWKNIDKKSVAIYGSLKSQLVTYLPKLPNVQGGLVEIVRDVALQFLVKRKEISATDLAEMFRDGMSGRLNGLDFERLGFSDVTKLVSAKSLNKLFALVDGKTENLFIQTDPLRDPSQDDMIGCESYSRLQDIVFSSGSLNYGLTKADRGLSYDRESKFVHRGALYSITAIDNAGDITARSTTEYSGLDGRTKELFGRTYKLKRVAPDGRKRMQKLSVVFGLVSYERETKVKANYPLNRTDGVVEAPSACDIRWKGELAEAVYLRLFCSTEATEERAAVARALCLSLQDVIDLKFPTVAHRVSVVSPTFEHAHTLAMRSANDIRLNCLNGSGEAVGVFRDAAQTNGSPGENQPVDGDYVEIIVIEDSDTTLGVVDSLVSAFTVLQRPATDPVARVWCEHLETLVETSGKGKQTAPASECDWAGAYAIFKELLERT